MTQTQYLLFLVLVTGGVTWLLRAFPFLAFGMGGRPPRVIDYIGRVLSPAAIAMLVVYCYCSSFSGKSFAEVHGGVAEFLAGAIVVGLQLWKKNPLLSILCGTAVYMVFRQKIF